jgi:Leucine-rich repeat (LRR) protein
MLFFTPLFSYSQFTSIPDANFEQALIDLGHDDVIDGQVLTSNISGVTSLDVMGDSISDLTGIKDFTALTFLNCMFNQLTSLDVSENTALIYLGCHDNQLTSLDVSQNNALITLECAHNQITNLDVSQNTVLNALDCFANQLICLNLKNGNNSNMGLLAIGNNFSLTCIEVDDVAYATANWTLDPGVTFSTNCNNACSSVGIEEYSNQPRKLIRILDLLGRETAFKPNTPLIYQFTDGSKEKVFVVE